MKKPKFDLSGPLMPYSEALIELRKFGEVSDIIALVFFPATIYLRDDPIRVRYVRVKDVPKAAHKFRKWVFACSENQRT